LYRSRAGLVTLLRDILQTRDRLPIYTRKGEVTSDFYERTSFIKRVIWPRVVGLCLRISGPTNSQLSSEYGTHKPVKARFWRWLSGEKPQNLFVIPTSLGSCNDKKAKVPPGFRSGISNSVSTCRCVPGSCPDLIRTSIRDEKSGSMKSTSHLNRSRHCKTASGTN